MESAILNEHVLLVIMPPAFCIDFAFVRQVCMLANTQLLQISSAAYWNEDKLTTYFNAFPIQYFVTYGLNLYVLRFE
jgi:hypothetical protein